MYSVLLILLHRPFVAEGHLHTEEPAIAVNSFSICSKAAKNIVRLLDSYDKTFSVRRAPYLISYSCYVSATIHVRIAGQREAGSNAHAALRTCLNVFNENMETNWAVRRAKLVIVNLMKQMGVSLEDEPEQSRTTRLARSLPEEPQAVPSQINDDLMSSETPHNPKTPELDIDMIIQSFIRDQGNNAVSELPSSNPGLQSGNTGLDPLSASNNDHQHQPGQPRWDYSDFAGGYTIDDLLFGFNGSAQDGLWIDRLDNNN